MDLYHLVNQPESHRDDEWERAFLQTFVDCKVTLMNDQAQTGPDGWPYFFIKTEPNSKESVGQILTWLADRGIGLVVNPHKMVPDYVFTYGMIWNFKETGKFLEEMASMPADQVVYRKDENWLFGAPTDAYLPQYVRSILRQFFGAQEIENPKILVASTSNYSQTDLLFSVESLGNPPQNEHRKIAEAISWFLPAHYSLVLANEEGLPQFLAL